MSGKISIQTEMQSIKGKKKPQGAGRQVKGSKDKKRYGVGEICIQEWDDDKSIWDYTKGESKRGSNQVYHHAFPLSKRTNYRQ